MNEDLILQAIADCNPNTPLEPGDPRFVDLDDIRGFALRERISKLLLASDQARMFSKVAVAGHRGSGKSTELARTQAELRDRGYMTLWASVSENLDPREISFSDVMRLIVQLIDWSFGEEASKHAQVQEAFRLITEWFREVTRNFSENIEQAQNLALDASIGGRAQAEVGAPGAFKFKTDLGRLSAAISVVRRSSGNERIEIRETIERYNNQLVEYVNSLLRAVTAFCCPGKSLVFILDNVDKYEPEIVNTAFLRHADLFHALEAHVIFTLQSSLLYKPVDSTAEQSFQTETLPMIPVFQRGCRDVDARVMERLKTAVFKRVPLELFEEIAIADEIIRTSGGCWRDLLRLLQESLLNARSTIRGDDVVKARQRVAQTYQRLLRSGEDLQALADAHLTHDVLSSETTRYLLHHLCILYYNGEGWYDIHPLLEPYRPVREAIDKARQASMV